MPMSKTEDSRPTIRLRQTSAGPAGREPFDLTDRGLMLGDGVFDTSLVVAGKIILMKAHLERLAKDAAALGIDIDPGTLRSFAADAIPDEAEDGALRLTVTRGPGPRGVAPRALGEATLISKFDPGPPTFPAKPLRLASSDIQRNPSAPSSRRKTLSYTDAVIGMQRARAAGFDDALYFTPGGHAACTSIANIFARFGRTLVTPPLEDGVVDGIIRAWLIGGAPDAGYDVEVASLSVEALARADALYLTNSLQLIRAVEGLDDIGFDAALPATLVELFTDLLAG